MFNTSNSIIQPKDDIPIALLVVYGGCFDGEKASIASLHPFVKYIIAYGHTKASTGVITMISGVETNIGALFVSESSGIALLDAVENQPETIVASQGGYVVELDGSVPKEYIRGRKIIALAPKIPALLSMIGSSYIIHSMIGTERLRNQKLKSTFNRLFLLLSITDIFSSLGLFFTTWMIPKETDEGFWQYRWDIEFPYAAGNQATCSFQVRKQ